MSSSILYMSSACQHSMGLMNDIHGAGLADRFTFFDISRQRGRPAYVDRVPMLVHDGRMYVDDDLFALFSAPSPDVHDPRTRLQASTNGASTSTEGEFAELAAYNEGVGGFCAHDDLGPLDQDSAALDMNAPVDLMVLEECEPMPGGAKK